MTIREENIIGAEMNSNENDLLFHEKYVQLMFSVSQQESTVCYYLAVYRPQVEFFFLLFFREEPVGCFKILNYHYAICILPTI